MKKWIIMIMAVVMMLTCTACAVPAKAPTNDSVISEGEIAALYTTPEDFKGRTFDFTAKVFTVEVDAEGIYMQAYYDISNYDKNTIIGYKGTDISIKEDDFIRVHGTVSGEFQGENYFGATITAPLILAHSIEVIDAVEAFPAEKTVTVDQTFTSGEYAATVSKVDFTKDETRIYLTIQNNSTSELNSYPDQGVVIQNGIQYETQWNFDYPSMASELRPGASTSGVIVFDRLDESDFTYYFDGYGEGFNTIDFEFDICVE